MKATWQPNAFGGADLLVVGQTMASIRRRDMTDAGAQLLDHIGYEKPYRALLLALPHGHDLPYPTLATAQAAAEHAVLDHLVDAVMAMKELITNTEAHSFASTPPGAD